MKHTLTIKWYYTVRVTIANDVTVKTLILVCSSWTNVSPLTYKTQLPSMWSTSCNIQHLAQEQSKHMIQWLMLRKRTLHHFRRANIAHLRSAQHDNVSNQMKATAAWRQKGSECWDQCPAYNLKRSFWQIKGEKHISRAKKRKINGSRIMWIERPLWQESEFKT